MLPFYNRERELTRLRTFSQSPHGGLAVLYGRRRCGKSRLLLESIAPQRLVYYLADEREPALQRVSLAAECARARPGFDRVVYPDWEALFASWWEYAPEGSVLALDEFPTLVSGSREVPSVLQRHLDRGGRHLVLCGSSQRIMHGLVLDRTAPLFGRALEILRVGPLDAGWTGQALGLKDPVKAVEAFAVWGGVPRYWELAASFASTEQALQALVLDPLGVLHDEPAALLLDDLRDTAQSASILQLVGQGCHRMSEIAGRLEKPTTSLARPLQRLVDLGLVYRQRPYGTHLRDTKRSLYRLADPFLRFWFRYVGPHRSRLRSRGAEHVMRLIEPDLPQHVGSVWEDLARQSVGRIDLHGVEWNEPSPWWGQGLDRKPLEIDVVAEALDGHSLLLGSVKWEEKTDLGRVIAELQRQSAVFPLVGGRQVLHAVWLKRRGRPRPAGVAVLDPAELLPCLR